jgi:alkanesulfonate monooxygenase SsuD/methylene tetrahydromethanopterin reductase-like flavin-dependent oxidoreductase (luciferase family)
MEVAMRYGMSLPSFGAFADPRYLIELAQAAEAAGWDGFFLWDTVIHDERNYPIAEPWSMLAAIATVTTKLKLGVMITPLSRRRPWQVARQVLTLDHLSNGHVIFGAGLGGAMPDFEWFGEEIDPKVRAAMLDEGLEIVRRLWSGERTSFEGKHYTVAPVQFAPPPVQPHIPIWIGGMWPNKAPMRRAARYDGVIALKGGFPLDPEDLAAIKAYIEPLRPNPAAPFDYVAAGITPGDDPEAGAAQVAPFIDAGATWWVETIDPWTRHRDWTVDMSREDVQWMDARIRQPPPRR